MAFSSRKEKIIIIIKVVGSFLSSAGLPCVVNLGEVLGEENVRFGDLRVSCKLTLERTEMRRPQKPEVGWGSPEEVLLVSWAQTGGQDKTGQRARPKWGQLTSH